VPEGGPAEQQEQCQDRELGGADALLTAVPVVPGQDEHDRQPDDEDEQSDLPHMLRPVEGLADVLEALQEPPGSGDVDRSPLDDLPAAQPHPGALGSALCPRAGHSTAPMASECSGIQSGCGCERARARAQALFTARRGGCPAVSIGCLDKVSRRARVGELGIWKPGILPRVAALQVPRIPAFQFSAPGERVCGRQPGELENWNAGNPRGAARGGSTGPAGAPEWPRRAQPGGGHGLPHGPATRVPGAARDATSEDARPSARERMFDKRMFDRNRRQAVGARSIAASSGVT